MRKSLLIILLLVTTATLANRNQSINTFIENNMDHFTNDIDGDAFPSNAPRELVANLRKLYKSPIGERLIKNAVDNDITISFIQGHYPDEAFATFDNTIIYTLEIKKWYENKLVEFENLPAGANLSNIGLDVLLAHEFGHTGLGRLTLNLASIDPFIRSEVRNGNLTTIFSREKIRQEEIRAARLFENSYRTFINVPIRRSYYIENDVLNN